MKNKFWELLDKSTIVTAVVTTAVSVTLCYLWSTGRPVPDDLQKVALLIYGWWFGGQSQRTATIIAKKQLEG